MRSAFSGLGISALVASLLAGCASTTPAPVVERPSVASPKAVTGPATPVPGKEGYVVKKGDTLYSIALDHGLDYKELSAWNNLDNPNRILVGQVLRVTAPEANGASAVAVAKPIGLNGGVERRSLDGNTETLKREPKVGKEAYSDEALGRAQKGGEIVIAKVETKPEARPEPKTEPKVEAKPEPKAEPRGAEGGDEPAWSWPAAGKTLSGFADGKSKGLDIGGKSGDPVLAAADGKVAYIGSGIPSYGQLLIIKHNATYLTAYAHNSRILVKEGQAVSRGQKVAEMGNTGTDEVKLHFEVRRQGKPVDPMKFLPAR